MKLVTRSFLVLLLIFISVMTSLNGFSASPPRMRPYTGIGVFICKDKRQDFALQLYEEPGLSRVGILSSSKLSGNQWIFGMQGNLPLIVSARKGDWLQLFYDDAGRKAWVEPQNQGQFLSWEQLLKLQTARMLPGLQPQFYQLQKQPGGNPIVVLTPKQIFKVLKLENDWGMVLTEQGLMGWLRWRDGDGRLTMGTGKP